MIEIVCNDRLGKKVRVKCNSNDTIGDLKKLVAAQTGTKPEKIVLKKWCKRACFFPPTNDSFEYTKLLFLFLDTIYKDNITLADYGKSIFISITYFVTLLFFFRRNSRRHEY